MWSMVAKVGGLALALLAIMGLVYHAGRRDEAGEWRAREAAAAVAQAKADAKVQTDAANTNSKIGADVRQAEGRVIWRTREIVRRVHEYVTPAADARCVVPNGFVRAYDAAAKALPAPDPGGDADSASGVPLSGVLGADVGNLGVGWLYRDRVRAWERWYCDHARDIGQQAPAELNCGAPGNDLGEPLF